MISYRGCTAHPPLSFKVTYGPRRVWDPGPKLCVDVCWPGNKNARGSCGAQHLSFENKKTTLAEGRPPPFVEQCEAPPPSGGGISALGLVRLVRSVQLSCLFLTKVFCPGAFSVFFPTKKRCVSSRPRNCRRRLSGVFPTKK